MSRVASVRASVQERKSERARRLTAFPTSGSTRKRFGTARVLRGGPAAARTYHVIGQDAPVACLVQLEKEAHLGGPGCPTRAVRGWGARDRGGLEGEVEGVGEGGRWEGRGQAWREG